MKPGGLLRGEGPPHPPLKTSFREGSPPPEHFCKGEGWYRPPQRNIFARRREEEEERPPQNILKRKGGSPPMATDYTMKPLDPELSS